MGLFDAVNPSNILSGEGLGSALAGAGTGFMIGGPTGAMIGAGAGLGMGAMKAGEAKRAEQRDINLAAATQEYSPWTGMQAGPIRRRDESGAMLQGAITGAQMYGMGKLGQAMAAKNAAAGAGALAPAASGVGAAAAAGPGLTAAQQTAFSGGAGPVSTSAAPDIALQNQLAQASNDPHGMASFGQQSPWTNMNMPPSQAPVQQMAYRKPMVQYPSSWGY